MVFLRTLRTRFIWINRAALEYYIKTNININNSLFC